MQKFVHALTGLVLASALLSAQKPSNADPEALLDSSSDPGALLERSRQISLEYSHSLPDFVCTEIISRYQLKANEILFHRNSADWVLFDKLTVNLSYFQQRESHELKLLNGKPTKETFDSLAVGAVSTGEFGGILSGIFDPNSQTSFRWERWTNDRRHPVGVYAYNVDKTHSTYSIENDKPGSVTHAIVGFHGTLEIDSETGEVIHLDHVVDDIPSELQIARTATAIDYDAIEVNGKSYSLPVHSQTNTDGRGAAWKNESTFLDYRKFNVSSNLNFGAAGDGVEK